MNALLDIEPMAAKPKDSDQLTTATLRPQLPAIRRKVYGKGQVLPVYQYGFLAGILCPLSRLGDLGEIQSKTLSMIEFRSRLTECCDEFSRHGGTIACYVICNRDRQMMLFVSPIFEELLLGKKDL